MVVPMHLGKLGWMQVGCLEDIIETWPMLLQWMNLICNPSWNLVSRMTAVCYIFIVGVLQICSITVLHIRVVMHCIDAILIYGNVWVIFNIRSLDFIVFFIRIIVRVHTKVLPFQLFLVLCIGTCPIPVKVNAIVSDSFVPTLMFLVSFFGVVPSRWLALTTITFVSCDEGRQKDEDKNIQRWICSE